MPVMMEFAIQMEDRAGTLGKFCRVLAYHRVNILAFHSFSSEGKSVVRIIVDNLTTTKNGARHRALHLHRDRGFPGKATAPARRARAGCFDARRGEHQ